MNDSIIDISHLSKAYHNDTILYNLNLSIAKGQFTTLLGASGSGKTTLLRLIAGLETPEQGEIIIAGKNVTHLPPQQRQVNTVFQSYALFPHMTVFDNIAFGLRCEGLDKKQIKQRVSEALSLVRLTDYAQRLPKQLSGGQQQRVAIARAVVKKPLVLLLDEPLSALDYRLRKTMRQELKHLQQELGISFLLVTHDQEEALSISDQIIVLEQGEIQQIGTPREIYETPVNVSVAQFIGETNLFNTQIMRADTERLTVMIEGIEFTLDNSQHFTPEDNICTVIRPEDFRVWDRSEIDSTEKKFPGKVIDVIYKGTTVDLVVELDSGKRIFASEFFDDDDPELNYQTNERVWAEWSLGRERVLRCET